MLQADSLPPEPPGKSLRLINYPEKISIHYKVINLHKYLLLCARPKDTKEDEINTKVTHSLLGRQAVIQHVEVFPRGRHRVLRKERKEGMFSLVRSEDTKG